MGGTSYRVPVTPIVPGSTNDRKTLRDLESMPVRGIVTNPANGTKRPAGTLPSDGYFELWVRATATDGRAQPLVAPTWNPQGYGANPINRVAVLVG